MARQPSDRHAGVFVYVSTSGDAAITVFRMKSATAEPEMLQKSPIASLANAGGGLSTPMAVSPDGRHLHVAIRKPPLPVASFAIDAESGRLAPLGMARIPASTPFLATDRTGRFLFSSANPGATLAVNAIDPDGRVEARARQVLHIGHKLHCIVVDAGNRNLYVSSTDDEVIFQFRFDAEAGTLQPNDPPFIKLSGGQDPRHMALSPDGRFLYVTTEAGGRVVCFAVDGATGRLAEKSGIGMMPDSFSGSPLTADIHVTPDGRFLYATERRLHTIVGYRVDPASGALSLIEATTTEKIPRAFAIAPDGSFLVVLGEDTGRMAAYAIDRETGKLIKGAELTLGQKPNWIEFVMPR
jgi:6-phosphogluconolactonase